MIYLDTSVLVALLSNESTAPALRRWYASSTNQIWLTSDWTLCEFSSAISLKQRTGQLNPAQAMLSTTHLTCFCKVEYAFWR